MKDNKSVKKVLMSDMWRGYCNTKDLEYLAKACENAPFFGQSEMSKGNCKKIKRIKKQIKRIKCLMLAINYSMREFTTKRRDGFLYSKAR